jgi:hypothetical protein
VPKVVAPRVPLNLFVEFDVEQVERERSPVSEGRVMASSTVVTGFHARCPLCGSPVLSLARSGRVLSVDLRAFPLGGELGRGYTLCDDCGVLADLPPTLTLN